MAKRPGEVSAPRAASMLGISEDTVRAWAKAALAGEASRLFDCEVRRDLVGRYWVSMEGIRRLTQSEEMEETPDSREISEMREPPGRAV